MVMKELAFGLRLLAFFLIILGSGFTLLFVYQTAPPENLIWLKEHIWMNNLIIISYSISISLAMISIFLPELSFNKTQLNKPGGKNDI